MTEKDIARQLAWLATRPQNMTPRQIQQMAERLWWERIKPKPEAWEPPF